VTVIVHWPNEAAQVRKTRAIARIACDNSSLCFIVFVFDNE